MMKTILLVLLIAATAESFVLLPSSQTRVSVARRNAIDDDISKIKNEYSQLLEELEKKRGKMAAIDVTEDMLEKALQMVALKKGEQEEKLAAAEEEFLHAAEDLEQAASLHRQASVEAAWAENQAALLESVDLSYEDMERSHAVHQLEEDALNLEVDAIFHELKAEAKHQKAADLLDQLEENEMELKATLKELKVLKYEKAMESSVQSVKDKLHLRSQED